MSSSTVLLRKGALGDVVLLGSVASTISGHVTVVTDARWRQVAERLTGVDAVIEWPNDPSVLPDGRVVDLQGNIRSRRLARGRAAHRLNKRSLRRRARLFVPALPARPRCPPSTHKLVRYRLPPCLGLRCRARRPTILGLSLGRPGEQRPGRGNATFSLDASGVGEYGFSVGQERRQCARLSSMVSQRLS